MQESELEPEFVSLLEGLRRPDPAVVPGNQMARACDVPAKLVTGACLNRLKMPMVPFSCHLKSVPLSSSSPRYAASGWRAAEGRG